MLIDDVTIEVFAGNGGSGRAAFNKTKMTLGPTGGNGGKGGDIILRGVPDISALMRFQGKRVFKADKGKMGGEQNREGKSGDDMILNVPVGTVIHFLPNDSTKEITKIGQQELVAYGGRGGRGNFAFRSSIFTSPKKFEEGEVGQSAKLRLELKLIADVGFVGLPNAGKSSLLNELTNARSRVANYPFTTLEPSLGAYYELILADIPGLIEGASIGKGLGIRFLRHIERTNIFFHLVSAESQDPVSDYKAVRGELGAYNKKLLTKKEYVFLSKCDMASPAEIQKKTADLKKLNPSVQSISVIDDKSLEAVKKILSKIAKEKTISEEQ